MREDIEKLFAQLHFKGMAEGLERIPRTGGCGACPPENWRWRR